MSLAAAAVKKPDKNYMFVVIFTRFRPGNGQRKIG